MIELNSIRINFISQTWFLKKVMKRTHFSSQVLPLSYIPELCLLKHLFAVYHNSWWYFHRLNKQLFFLLFMWIWETKAGRTAAFHLNDGSICPTWPLITSNLFSWTLKANIFFLLRMCAKNASLTQSTFIIVCTNRIAIDRGRKLWINHFDSPLLFKNSTPMFLPLIHLNVFSLQWKQGPKVTG